MTNTFGELIQHLIVGQIMVSIGSGENELRGMITSFDKTHNVLVFQDHSVGGSKHFIPLTSVRSMGVNESEDPISCYLDLFKK